MPKRRHTIYIYVYIYFFFSFSGSNIKSFKSIKRDFSYWTKLLFFLVPHTHVKIEHKCGTTLNGTQTHGKSREPFFFLFFF